MIKILTFKIIKFFQIVVLVSISFFCSFPIKSELKTTTGKVIHREIYTSGGMSSSTRYHILLKYIYEVDGKLYESKRIGYMRIFYNTREMAEKTIQPYQLEKPVTVYYLPNDPSESYLEVDEE